MTRRFRTILSTSALICSTTSAMADMSGACQGLLAGERLTIAVPNSAGGGYDTYARALAPVLEKHGNLTARVTNMPSGGGLAARSFVMNADAETLSILIENTADMVSAPMGTVGRGDQANKTFMIEGYDIVGIVHSEPSTWIGRAGLDLLDPDLQGLVASEGALDEALLPFFVVGRALGIDIEAVTGYEGTSEMTAAILRGEADISGMSLTTSKRRAQDEGIEIMMVLSEGPYPEEPDLPYLAGEGSIAWALTEDLPEEDRVFQRGLAESVARLRGSARGMFVSTNMSDVRQACVAELMDAAISDPEFVASAEAQGRPVASMNAEEAAAFTADLISAYANVSPTLEAIAAEVMNN